MFKRTVFVAAIALMAAPVFADQNGGQAVTVQPGQGPSFTVVIPSTPPQAPYALTGNAPAQSHMVLLPAGQGGGVWVRVGS